MVRGLILAATATIALSAAHAADLEGVSMPDTRVVAGTQMWLNGIGLRTYSALGIRIYVAGLYLERRNGDPDTILHSQERKLLDIRFLRDVDAEDARKAWQESFEQNCSSPCDLILATCDGSSRRFHPCIRAMTRHCYSPRRASISLSTDG
jgi:hypothetical protein